VVLGSVLEVYLATCVVVAWLGRRRMLGFWGNAILAFFVSPLVVAIIIFAGSARPKAPAPPVKPVAG
jgi:hypothetical protein